MNTKTENLEELLPSLVPAERKIFTALLILKVLNNISLLKNKLHYIKDFLLLLLLELKKNVLNRRFIISNNSFSKIIL